MNLELRPSSDVRCGEMEPNASSKAFFEGLRTRLKACSSLFFSHFLAFSSTYLSERAPEEADAGPKTLSRRGAHLVSGLADGPMPRPILAVAARIGGRFPAAYGGDLIGANSL